MKLVAIVVIAGAVMSSAQSLEIPPIGRLVEVDGRRIHVNCTGSGSPAVVLEAGGGSFAVDWALVQPEVARTRRVCSYDRAGYGWSDPSPDAETPASVAHDLHAALRAAGERPPFIMVGHSMGGVYVRIYQRRFPDDVVGMVLVDPSHEDDLSTMFSGKAVTIGSLTAEQLLTTVPPGDVRIPLRSPQAGAPFDRLPSNLYAVRVELERRWLASASSKPIPHHVVVDSVEGQRAALAELQQVNRSQHPLGRRPLVVLSRGIGINERLKSLHAGLAQSSANGRHQVVEGAGHEIHLFQPNVVVEAISDVLQAAATNQRLPSR